MPGLSNPPQQEAGLGLDYPIVRISACISSIKQNRDLAHTGDAWHIKKGIPASAIIARFPVFRFGLNALTFLLLPGLFLAT